MCSRFKRRIGIIMTFEERLTVGMDMLYLVRCALSGSRAELKEIKSDLTAVFHTSMRHSLTSLCAFALDGVLDKKDAAYHAFNEARNKATAKQAMFDIERAALFAFFEERGIKYMPMKGIIIKNYYPKSTMRQMADNDIWYDVDRKDEVFGWFADRGYKMPEYEDQVHDVFFKEPVFNFEMHKALYGTSHREGWKDYYNEKMDLLSASSQQCALRLSDEDFYVYITSHAHKHHFGGGTGLRTLVDFYVMDKQLGGVIDSEYTESEMKKLGIYDFAAMIIPLSRKILDESAEPLDEEESSWLETILLCGTYGTSESAMKNQLIRINKDSRDITLGTKIRYILRRFFVTPSQIKEIYHVRESWKVPFYYLYRYSIRFVMASGRLFKEMKLLFKVKGDRKKKVNNSLQSTTRQSRK